MQSAETAPNTMQQWLEQHAGLWLSLRPDGSFEIISNGDGTITMHQAKKHAQKRGGKILMYVTKWQLLTDLPAVVACED